MPLITWVVTAILAAGPAQASSPAPEPSTGPSGDGLYRVYCATCHGRTGKGDGPLADSLRKRPPDLTLFAKRGGGLFDPGKVQRIVDGRQPVKGHGGSDMPVWGDAFSHSVDGYTEEAVKARIEAIVRHLKSIQVQ